MYNFHVKIEDIIQNAGTYHQAYYKAETFSGPSLYFHKRALGTRRSDNFHQHIEYVYAALVSWGMHRVGGGPRMRSFECFLHSIKSLARDFQEAAQISCENICEQNWASLKKIFFGIDIMETQTKLVGNSKVMAHMLPNIIPPIDRQYVLKFFERSLKNDMEYEWGLIKDIIQNFFIPVAQNEEFVRLANIWIGSQNKFPWDTSVFKIIDNLIIGKIKSQA